MNSSHYLSIDIELGLRPVWVPYEWSQKKVVNSIEFISSYVWVFVTKMCIFWTLSEI